jgi:hypothetical protein
MRRIRTHLTFSNVVAIIALFIALGGVSYAAFKLPKNSVKSKNIVNHQVKSNDLAKPSPTQSAGLVSANDCSSAGPNQWIAQSPGTAGDVGYYRDLDGQVHLTGIAQKCGSPGGGAVMFQARPGYRPQFTQEQAAALIGDKPTDVTVFDDGEVAANVSSKDAVSLAGISFRCYPPGKNGCPKTGK